MGKNLKIFLVLISKMTKRRLKNNIYKYRYWRKDEKLRYELNLKPFYEATIEYIEPNQHVKSGYFLKKEHSVEFNNISIKINIKQNINDNEKQNFISLFEEIMNKSNIYDLKLFKSKFQELYN